MITPDKALAVAHAAAALAYQRLGGDGGSRGGASWYSGAGPNGNGSAVTLELGAFVERWPDATPEALYRTAMAALKRKPGDYAGLPEAQRAAYEVFLAVAVLLYGKAEAARRAELDVAASLAAQTPSGLRRRDSIFARDTDPDWE